MYELAREPDIQNKALQEIISIVGRNKNQPILFNEVKQMKYVECIIKEAMRHYPPVPFVERILDEDTEISNTLKVY